MRVLLTIAAVLVVTACASKAPVDPRVSQVATGTTQERTSFDTFTKYQGPEQALPSEEGYALLRSWVYTEKRDQHQLYVRVLHSEREREFISASKPGGKQLKIKQIDSGPTCKQKQPNCPIYEDIGIWLDEARLKKAAKENGLTLRLNAKRGDNVIVEIPAWYLKGYLQRVQ